MDVIGASAAGPWVDDLNAWGIRHEAVAHATRSVSIGDDVLALGELVRLFRRLRPDIVHTHNPKPGVYGRVAARLAGVPVVVNTVHGLYASPDDPLLRRVLVYGVERAASDVLTSRARPERRGRRRPGTPAGAAPQAAAARQRRRPGPVPAPTRGGRVGAAIPRRRRRPGRCRRRRPPGVGEGVRRALRGGAATAADRPEVVVVVVGPTDPAKSGSLTQADIERASALGNVVFLGERRDVRGAVPGFDLFVLASHREGFPARPWRRPRAACRSSRRTSAAAGRWSTTGTPGCWCRSATRWPGRRRSRPSPPIRLAAGRWAWRLASGPRPEFDDRRVIARTLT